MNFVINKDEFSKALAVVVKGINTHFTLPVYSCVCIDADREAGTITLQTADTETYISYAAAALVNESGKVVIPAKLLNDLIKSLPNEAITIESSDSNLATLTCSNSTFTLTTFQPEDFPAFPQVEEVNSVYLSAKELDSMVKSVIYALSVDQARPILTGILIEIISNTITLVATDSYRVAKIQAAIPGDPVEDFSVVVPGTTMKNVISSLSGEATIRLSYTDNQIIFTFGNTIFITRRIEGNFPNYRKVFPVDFSTAFTCSVDNLVDAIKRIRILVNASPMKNSSIKLSISADEGTITITANFADIGGGVERVPAVVEGESLDIAFNPGYLLDGLSSVESDEIRAEFSMSSRPGVFKNNNREVMPFDYLVMPVRSS